MIKWSTYPNDRKICDKGSYVIIVPSTHFENEVNNVIPIFCDVCGIRFGHKDDEETYKKFSCCSPCADKWAYSNKEKWLNGWRPTQEEVKISVTKRSFVDPNIVFE
jgi:hypothetical protein